MYQILYFDIYKEKRRTPCHLGDIFLFRLPGLIESICGRTGKMKHMQKLHDFEKKKELDQLKNVICSIRTPTGYGSSLDKAFTIDEHITGFKTHDFHNFMKVLYAII